MHQPYYREGLYGDYRLPWVYLHGIKDYSDMAAHLEDHPGMKAVVNFTPVLLEQLDDYAQQLKRLLDHGTPTQEPLLNYLAGVTPIPEDRRRRAELVAACRRAHAPKMIEPYTGFRELTRIFDGFLEGGNRDLHEFYLDYLYQQYFIDLLVWYHLAWMGHSLRATHRVCLLMGKGRFYDDKDRRKIIEIIYETLAGLIPRYKALADKGQIELSMTPWGHPIVPLLNDLGNMRDAQPADPAPKSPEYPGGTERSMWHLQHGLKVFEKYFGRKPVGMWLSEGSVSDDAIAMLDELGIRWTASGEAVWHHSCHISETDPTELPNRKKLFQPYRLKDYGKTSMFFRDDGLSDLVGFEYSNWHADDAVANFVHNLSNVADFLDGEADQYVISVILDGENAWEYYPENGHYFLDGLYKSLSNHKKIKPRTFADITADPKIKSRPLNALVAGSWVYGSFSTWIGSQDKNNAWDLLVAAKKAYDRVVKKGDLNPEELREAERQLGVCESSDWFWWFGDYNPSDSVSDFDNLFRLQLKKLYAMLKQEPPATLDSPISKGGGAMENAGTMRRSN